MCSRMISIWPADEIQRQGYEFESKEYGIDEAVRLTFHAVQYLFPNPSRG